MLRLLRRIATSEYLVFILTVIYVVCLWPIAPQIVSIATLREVLIAMLPLLILAIGQTFVLVIAGIDLSITSIVAMSSVLAASVMTGDGGYLAGSSFASPLACLIFVAVGLLIGAANGLCVTRLGMPSFMVTLVSQTFLSGAAVWFTSLHSDSVSIGNLPKAFTVLGRGDVMGIPYALIVALGVTLGAYWVLQHTIFGRWLFAVGNNPRAALVSGVPVKWVVLIAFVLSGACAGIASIIYTGRLETGTPVLGQRVLLDVIGAAVIGGVSLFGGKAKIIWVIFGVLFLAVVDKGLQLLGLSLFIVFAVKGSVILIAAGLDALRNQFLLADAR
jgi:ribose/xylose/arabinose/galactoside ABC-type transport system permease subunit